MIVRNSVILVDQIELDKAKGLHPWDAVIDATVHRLRPIYLTALAATLGMVPIAREVFWGPMAYAVIGGLLVATLLTLLFLPALYVAWFRIKEPGRGATVEATGKAGRWRGRRLPPARPRRRRRAQAMRRARTPVAVVAGGHD